MSLLFPFQVSGPTQSPAAPPGGLLQTPGLQSSREASCPEASRGTCPLRSPPLNPGAGPQCCLLEPPLQTPGHRIPPPTNSPTLGLTPGGPWWKRPTHLVSEGPEGPGEGLEDSWVPCSPGPRGSRSCLSGGVIAWKEVSLVPALFASPSHLPFLSELVLGGTSTFDPFAKPPVSTETKEGLEGAQALPSGKPSSPVGKQAAGDDTALGNEGPAQSWPLPSSSCRVSNPSPDHLHSRAGPVWRPHPQFQAKWYQGARCL